MRRLDAAPCRIVVAGTPEEVVLDLGTGAGVPGIALAVCEAGLQLTFLDRSQKKMTFLRRVAAGSPDSPTRRLTRSMALSNSTN